MDLRHLNPSQRAAVECVRGPLLVLAGAGSGKTRVITTRIAYLLSRGVEPASIVALSFTNKAAEEMRARVAAMVGPSKVADLLLGTFHNLGVRMMRADPKGFGVPKRFSILDQGDVYGIVRSLLREHGMHGSGADRRFDVGAIVQRISLWKNDFLDAEAARERVAAGAASEYDEIAAALYEPYDDRLRSLGACDFDDLVCRIASRLMEDPKLRQRWAQRLGYVMVDEYQDTNTAQFEMVRALLNEEENLCVVGDDDQAIYGWRGAKVGNILGFDMYFRDATVIKLEENYRSRPQITAAANAVIVKNLGRHDKVLRPTRDDGESVMVVTCEDDAGETRWVGDRIRKLIVEARVRPSDIAVLYRSARLAPPVEERLQAHGISYRVVGGQSFYDKKEAKDVLAYLKVMVTPHDDLAVRRALDTPPRGIGRKTMDALTHFAEQRNCRLIDAVHRSREIEGLGARPAQALAGFSALIQRASRESRAGGSVVAPLMTVLETVAMRENVLKETGSPEATQLRWAGVEWLLTSLQRFEANRGPQDGGWHEYLGNMSLSREEKNERIDDAEQNGGLVTLATLHSSKGLEWPHVFIIGCEEGILPHRRVVELRINDAIEGDLEEERRLFYVGITRARDRLWLTRAAKRVDRGRECEVQPSRFLADLPEASISHYDVRSEETLGVMEMEALADAFMARFAAGVASDPPLR